MADDRYLQEVDCFMSNLIFTIAQLAAKRAQLNCLDNGAKITDDAGACQFIRERGFVMLMPLAELSLPSLSAADEAEPWEGFGVTDRAWAWKETLPGRKLCAYSKLFQGRGTFIDWRLYASFLKVYGPDGDIDYEYENGLVNRVDRDLYRLVERFGPIDSRELWKLAKPLFAGKRSRLVASLDRLQAKFYLTTAGGSVEGWSLHIWDLVERQAPPRVLAKLPSGPEARAAILRQTIANCYAISEKQLRSILRWNPTDLQHSLLRLQNAGLISHVQVEGENLPWWTVLEVRS
jgi:hypothetical protein